MYKDSGFSFLDLIVAMCVMAILTGLALPNAGALFASFERNEAINQLVADISEGRAQALANGARVIFQVSANGDSYTLGLDTLPLNDPPEADTIMFTRNLGAKTSIEVSDSIIFSSRGYITDDIGDPTNINISLSRNGEEFCSGVLYPIGSFEYDCEA